MCVCAILLFWRVLTLIIGHSIIRLSYYTILKLDLVSTHTYISLIDAADVVVVVLAFMF